MKRLAAYEKFHERLLSGEIRPGQFVTQKELAALVGLPLGATREAIQRLEFESLLRVYPQRGIQVAEVTTKLIRSAYGFRMILEIESVRKFARSADVEVVQQLYDETARILTKAKGDVTAQTQEEAVEVDWKMHDAVIDHQENDILSEAYRVNAARIRLVRGPGNRLPIPRVISALEEHLVILEACLAKDEDRASRELERHISKSLRLAIENA